MINHASGLTIYDFFKKKKLFSEVITEYTTNLHFIFGSSGKTDFPPIDKNQVAFLFDQIRHIADQYDIIILDTASGAGDEIIDIILNADVNVIVTNPEPTAVMDAYVMIKLLNKNRYNKRKYILVNRCNNLKEGTTTFNNLSSAADHFLRENNLFLLGTAYSGPEVSQSIVEQNLLVKKYPYNPISLQIAEASSRLIEYVQMANIMQTSE
jgi:flagellar biosynthesis protein FlhG